MKLHQIVREWLSEFKTDNDDYCRFYSKFFGNKKFYSNLASAIENKSEIESICHQIYNFAHKKNPKLNNMLLDFLPVILETYLILSFTTPKNPRDSDNSPLLIRTCLLSVYNLLKSKITAPDDLEKDSKPSFFIPIFTDGSIFHSQVARPDLDFLNYSLTVSEPKPVVINDRQLIPGLIRIYNQFICDFSEVSLNDFCSMSTRLASLTSQPRIEVTSDTLNELLVGIYFVLFKESHADYARQALTAIESRANYEIMTSAMLTATAVRNSLRSSVAPVKRRAETITSENLITNASFRPEKVAEDLEHLLLLDVNQNSVNHARPAKGDHAVEIGDISVHFSVNATSGKSSKTGKAMIGGKSSKNEQKSSQYNVENRSHESETQFY